MNNYIIIQLYKYLTGVDNEKDFTNFSIIK